VKSDYIHLVVCNSPLSRAEFDIAATTQFNAGDKNSDGMWTADEMHSFQKDSRSAARSYQSQTRQIDPDLTEPQKRHSGDVDKNSDGYISQNEQAVLRDSYRRAGRGRLGSNAFSGRGLNTHALHRMDVNADGQISQSEFMALSEERFDDFDINQDGQLSGDESISYNIVQAGRVPSRSRQYKHLEYSSTMSEDQTEAQPEPRNRFDRVRRQRSFFAN